MAETSCVDYSQLKKKILEMWVPVAGMQRITDIVRENWKYMLTNIFNMDSIPCVLKHTVEKSIEAAPWGKKLFQKKCDGLFDTKPPFQIGETIIAGSFNEGRFLYSTQPPDMDIMCVLKNIRFSQNDQKNGSLLMTETTPFVSAFITNEETKNLWNEFLDDHNNEKGTPRLSSQKLKKKMGENYQRTGRIFRSSCNEHFEEIAEGAAVTIQREKPPVVVFENCVTVLEKALKRPANQRMSNEDKSLYQEAKGTLFSLMFSSCDVVLSIFCEGWPSCAREWITRDRLWPNTELVKEIAQSGFHIVPKASSHGDLRLSFSFAESTLIKRLIILKRRVLRAFKAVVKYHQNTWSPNSWAILTSYHLKTIAFWHFEKSSQESWTEETIVHHLLTMLEELAEALRNRDIPMYFMPRVNLLQNVDDIDVFLALVEKISYVSSNFTIMCKAVDNSNIFRKFSTLTA